MDTFVIMGKVWKYQGPSGWYFVYVGDKESLRIKNETKGKKKVGFGFIPVRAALGNTSWKTTIFPTKEGPYLISIKAEVRKKEHVLEGDTVRISCVFI